MNRRGADRTGPLGGAGMVGLWGASSLVSVQHGTISTTAASATATISAVNTANSLLLFNGQDNPYASGNTVYDAFVAYTLTNSTTVTQTRSHTDGSALTGAFCVVEFAPGVVRSVQYGTVSLATGVSNTASITSVNTSKSIISYLGQTTNDFNSGSYWNTQYNSCRAVLTNATTVTATRRSDAGFGGPTVYFVVVEFF